MKKNNKVLIGVGVALFILVAYYIGTYNDLQKMDENVDAKWAQVENQLQRRYELIPNLVKTVKGYTEYESETLTAIVDARNNAENATTMKEKEVAEKQLTTALNGLNVVVEAYPELKADTVFTDLMIQLEGTQNRITVARKDYNDSIQDLNSKIRLFPVSMIAASAGIDKAEYFDKDEKAAENPNVDFGE